MTNLIYSNYLLPEVVADMDRLGYKKNSQGQHNADDIFRYFNGNKLLYESTSFSVRDAAKKAGALDAQGNTIEYDNAEDALQRAQQHNQNSKGTVATVYKKGDKFTIVVEARDSKTQNRAIHINTRMQQWNTLCQVFKNIGIDIRNLGLPQSLFNALEAKQAVSQLINISQTANKWLDKNAIKTILALNSNTTQVQRLVRIFGSMDDAVDKIFDSYRQQGAVTPGQKTLIDAALTSCKKFPGIDLQNLYDTLNQIEDTVNTTSTEGRIEDVIKDLDKKYHINKEEIVLTSNHLKDLKEAAASAIVTLQRQLKKWQAEKHNAAETDALQSTLQEMMRNLDTGRYYKGIISFLDEAVTKVRDIENLLSTLSTTGDTMSNLAVISRTLMDIKNIQDGYMGIVKALINVERIDTEGQLTDQEKQDIVEAAKKITDFFETKEAEIKDFRKRTMTDIAVSYLGESLAHSEAGFNIIEMADADASIWDYFYGAAECSDAILAVFGSVLREAQDKRDGRLNDISLRIRRATNTLYETTDNTEFMYESNGYIISDRDWSKYNAAREAHKKSLKAQGIHGLDLYEEMKQWEIQNTELRVVDNTINRKERVPNAKYAKAFPTLTAAQQEYYNTMMQLKGELGSLLPEYAQKQYLPPQKRRSFNDAMHAAKKEGTKGVIRALQSKWKELLAIREDDIRYSRNGIIEGEEFGVATGTMSDSRYRQIPIFFINRVEEQGELLKDFSGVLQSFASTAVNYQCMNEIRDTIEFMADYLSNDRGVAEAQQGRNMVDRVNTGAAVIWKKLIKQSSTGSAKTLIDAWLSANFYGTTYENDGRAAIIFRNILQYTSIKSLAMNIKGAMNNFDMAMVQMLIEAGGGQYYGMKDFLWAIKKTLGDNTLGAPGRFWDFVTNNVNSESVLLSQIFDPLSENFREMGNQRYYKGVLRHLIGHDMTMIGYGMGEHPVHFMNMYAILHSTKIKIDGKPACLYDAFSVKHKKEGNSELEINPKATYTNEQGQDVPIDQAYIQKIRRLIRGVNRQTHGGMDEGSRGAIHNWILGKALMVLKQWMVGHYSRRFRGKHYDFDLGEVEGYYVTVGKLMRGLYADLRGMEMESAIRWSEMTDHQKANVRKVATELSLLGMLFALQMALGDPDDHKHDYWRLLAMYLVKRGTMELNASNPIGVVTEADKMVNNPIASTKVINSLLYPFWGLFNGDMFEEMKRGRHKGENKYWYRVRRYTLPFYKDVEQYMYWAEDEGVMSMKYTDQLNM